MHPGGIRSDTHLFYFEKSANLKHPSVHIHPIIVQNSGGEGILRKCAFVRSNGRKTTFAWPKEVSDVIFPRFWGVVCICIFSKSPHLRISALLWDECGHQGGTKTINSTVGLFRLAGGPFSANVSSRKSVF